VINGSSVVIVKFFKILNQVMDTLRIKVLRSIQSDISLSTKCRQ
jgi:hypothetical protein